MALYFNVEGLNKKVIPNIELCNDKLGRSYDILANIAIPYDFEYKSKLANIPSRINDIKIKNTNIKNWVDESVNKLQSAEQKNTKAMEGLINTLSQLRLNISSKIDSTGAKAFTKSTTETNITKNYGSLPNVKSAIRYVFSGQLLSDTITLAKKTASKVATKIKSAISWTLATGAKIVKKVINVVFEKVKATLEWTGAKIISGGKWIYKNVVVPGWQILKKVGASVGNVVISFLKGIIQFVESLFDVIVILGTAVASQYTGAWDLITYLVSDNKEEWKSATSEMWKGTMSFVAEDHVGNAFSSFYKESAIGKWLDENAYGAFKSEGTASNIISGLGYVAGIIVLSIATLRNWRSSNCGS